MKTRRSTVGIAFALATALVAVVAVGAASSAMQVAPVNTAPPTITGTAAVGQTLTAQNGTWSNTPTAYQYQWLRCNATGASCVGIPGATMKTYPVVSADSGNTLRVRVTAVNADGAANARSAATAGVTSTDAPKNSARPTISGDATVGQELTADPGTWSGSPTFTYQWQRCDVDAAVCFDVIGATGKTYGVRDADTGFRMAVEVTAKSSSGSGMAKSAFTDIVDPKATIVNARPTLRIVSVRFVGARVYARFRICDDSMKNVTILQTDSRPGKANYNRRFATLVAPEPCGVYTRSWVPAPRFRGPGRYTITLAARDKSTRTSLPARRTFNR